MKILKQEHPDYKYVEFSDSLNYRDTLKEHIEELEKTGFYPQTIHFFKRCYNSDELDCVAVYFVAKDLKFPIRLDESDDIVIDLRLPQSFDCVRIWFATLEFIKKNNLNAYKKTRKNKIK